MTDIYFVRHSKVLYTEDDRTRPLSEEGIRDVAEVTKFFKDVHIDRIISSPYDRAINTIQPVSELKGISIETYEELRERKVSNEFIDDFQTFIHNQWGDFDFKLHEGESLNMVRARGTAVINELLERYKGEKMIIGTHGTFMSVMLNTYDVAYDFNFWKSVTMPDIYRVTFDGHKCIEIKHYPIMKGK